MGTGPGCGPLRCSSDLHSVARLQRQRRHRRARADQGCGGHGLRPRVRTARKANKSTIGCDYYSVDPDIVVVGGRARASRRSSPTRGPAPVTHHRRARRRRRSTRRLRAHPVGHRAVASRTRRSPDGQLPPGQVAILFLGAARRDARRRARPAITPAVTSDATPRCTAPASATRSTSRPARRSSAYDIFPYGGGQSAATSATLLLPTTAWDTNYIAVDAFGKSPIVARGAALARHRRGRGRHDGHHQPDRRDRGAATGVAGRPARASPQTYTLNEGQVLQFTQDAELTGSPIQSNKPIGVWGGRRCLNIDVEQRAACDCAHQQIPPVQGARQRVRRRSLPQPLRRHGRDAAVAARRRGRRHQLTWEPAHAARARPTTLALGQVAEFRAAGPFVVKSQDAQHPFYMSRAHDGLPGGRTRAHGDCRGDPEFVNVIPPQQYLASYVFFTDPTYPETNLVLVRTQDGGGLQGRDARLRGRAHRLDAARHGGQLRVHAHRSRAPQLREQDGCDNGRHEIHSDAPFGLTVWGWGTAETGGVLRHRRGRGFYRRR